MAGTGGGIGEDHYLVGHAQAVEQALIEEVGRLVVVNQDDLVKAGGGNHTVKLNWIPKNVTKQESQ